MRHELNIYEKYFEAQVKGLKTFELRKNDRNFQVGDSLKLNEFNGWGPMAGYHYTGRYCLVNIIHILTEEMCDDFLGGLKDGYCILGTKLLHTNALELLHEN